MDTQLFSESLSNNLPVRGVDDKEIEYYKYTQTTYGHARVAQDIRYLVDALPQVPILQTDVDARNMVETWNREMFLNSGMKQAMLRNNNWT